VEIIRYPKKEIWTAILERPFQDFAPINALVQPILSAVKEEGDKALFKLTAKYDKADLKSLAVTQDEISNAIDLIKPSLKGAIRLAAKNIKSFHENQLNSESRVETMPGISCWRKNVAIQKAGLYIPGGSAPLFSTVLMLGIPAKLAGCKEIILCTPPSADGSIHPAILFAASEIGLTKIFKLGGAQAVAAMAYGTEWVPAVDKIFGPGNLFVTSAKQIVATQGVAIDMPAGPSEVLVIADESCVPSFVASDLLSQAEHGADSQVVLVTTSEEILKNVEFELKSQLATLPRKEIAAKALENSALILVENIETAIDLSNVYAPEHLILAIENVEQQAEKIINAGSVFLGNYSPEAAGDYASGTNHVLPTNNYARNYSGVSVESFTKKVTFQQLSKEGLNNIGNAVELMAEAEDLQAHKNAVTLRLKS